MCIRDSFKIVTPPDDLSEVRAKTKKIHREKLKKIVVPVILIALAVSGTYLDVYKRQSLMISM